MLQTLTQLAPGSQWAHCATPPGRASGVGEENPWGEGQINSEDIKMAGETEATKQLAE